MTKMINTISIATFSILVTIALADSCFFSSTACSCALKPASGTCYTESSPGMCLSTQCAQSWKCDCMNPTHLCSRATCTKHQLMDNAVTNAAGETQCEVVANNNCVRVLDIIAYPTPTATPMASPIVSP